MVNNEKLRIEFSDRLHKALNDAGVRVRGRATDVAREMTARAGNVTPAAAGKWLKGEAIPNALHMRALADWLAVRVEWLQYNSEPMRGAAKVGKAPIAGPLTLRLSARLADLERRGKLTKELVRLMNAAIDFATSAINE